ncbi:Peptidoglycan D,D-transpeptidase MrdA (EC [Olavius algarvensis Delta 1 endosymbiont]|nr:Peptidoglycan D,D-transpeptidase MrdA (EC [Olavius algarvensis Delta 1 endosymbiont]
MSDKYLKTADAEWYRQRITGVMVCVIAAFAILLLRLIFLQVIRGDEFRLLSLNNRIRLQSIDPPRGLIYDRNGDVLAENRPSFDVAITLKDARPVKATINKLAQYLDVAPETLQSKLSKSKGVSSYKPIVIKQDIGRNALALVEAHKYDLPGITVNVKLRRHYLNIKDAVHLIGYLSEISPGELTGGKYPGLRRGDLIGKFGAEKAFESFLQGERGGRQVEVNANGRVVRVLKTVPAKPGHNIHLTLDFKLQKKAESLLNGVAGAAVAVDPESGRILALASSPSFDQSFFVDGMSHEQWDSLISNPFRPMENKAIQGEYPPGSTYKIITAIAGLVEAVIDENTEVYCPGYYRFGNRVYRCWEKGGHGRVKIVKAIAESCDVFFYQVGDLLGVDRLAWYAKAAGLGSSTGIRLDKEAKGLIPTAAWKKERTGIAWQKGETLSVAIGQGFNLATPLQMASMTAAIANGGTRYKPIILDSIKMADGRLAYQNEPQVLGKIPLNERALELVRKGLWEVVNGKRGTARGSRLVDIEFSGKTGTSQVVSRKKDDFRFDVERPAHLRPHAWFVAFAPSDKPQIAIAVMIEHGEHGFGAAPIAREMIKSYLRSNWPIQKAANEADGDANDNQG